MSINARTSEINDAYDTAIPRQYPEAISCAQPLTTLSMNERIRTIRSRASRSIERRRYEFKLPSIIHGLTIEGRSPKSVTIPKRGRTFLWSSLDHTEISRRNRCLGCEPCTRISYVRSKVTWACFCIKSSDPSWLQILRTLMATYRRQSEWLARHAVEYIPSICCTSRMLSKHTRSHHPHLRVARVE